MSEYSQFPEDVATDDCLLKYSYIFSPDILKEKVAFITGGGSGIGFRIAEILMRHGCQTIIASRSLERVQASARKLTAATGQRCLPVSVDVRQPATIIAAVEETLRKFGKIDILVNGAAGNFLCPASGLSFNAFKTVLEIDTIGTFNTSKVLYQRWLKAIQWRSPLTERVGSNLPALSKEMTISCLSGGVGDSIVDLKPILGALLMAQLDHGGVIVNITATLSYRGQILQLHAGTAKAAIDAMTKHLAVEWGPDNIRVNSLAPGPISGTEGFRKLGGLVKSMADHYKLIPLQRVGTKTEIAHGVLYLVSPAASYVTGTLLVIDGGHWLTGANNMSAMQALLQKPAKL